MRSSAGILCVVVSACSAPLSPSGPALPDEVWIPAGTFSMGHSPVETAPNVTDFAHPHSVALSAYFIDRYVATNAQYKACYDAHECPDEVATVPGYTFKDARLAAYPFATLASFDAAEAYCRWMGKRLPTEAEWERAARGPDSFDYPWGNQRPDCARLHCDRPPQSPPFGYFWRVGDDLDDVSAEGVHGMLTGVLETVSDHYAEDYYSVSTNRNPHGPQGGLKPHVARGNWHSVISDIDHLAFNVSNIRCRPGSGLTGAATRPA